jgi:hypothetical protein
MDFETPYTFLMQIWSGIAADIIQLATAALVLPIIFLRNVLAVPEHESLSAHLNKWLYSSWIFLFLAIGTGVFYRAANTCLIGKELTKKVGATCVAYPNLVFGLFALFFVLGIGFFALGVILSLRRKNV